MKIILIVALSLAVLGLSVGYFHTLRNAEDMLHISEDSHSAYLSERFTTAYSMQPVNVAIWEGTNLVSYLNENWGSSPSTDRCARMAFIHARLSALFKEAGMTNEAIAEAGETSKWVQKISTNSSFPPDIAVTRLLEKDKVERFSAFKK